MAPEFGHRMICGQSSQVIHADADGVVPDNLCVFLLAVSSINSGSGANSWEKWVPFQVLGLYKIYEIPRTNVDTSSQVCPFERLREATLLNPARSYLVQFVTDSSAGFLVRDVKLTPEMFLKIFVLIGGTDCREAAMERVAEEVVRIHFKRERRDIPDKSQLEVCRFASLLGRTFL